jgi:diaminopimelate epimerase
MDLLSLSPLANRLIVKMNGLGNEIAVLDLRGTGLTVSGPEARAIGRGEGLAFDQLLVLHEPRSIGADAFMMIYNRDGSQAESCGNGTRCVAFILTRGTPRKVVVLETAAARLECLRSAETIFTVDMGRPRLAWNEIPLRDPFHDTRKIELQVGPIDAPILHSPSVVSMGNPHAIFWVDDVNAYDLERFGPLLENHPIFPERANITLAHIVDRDHITIRTWERGAGLTKACGSAACATAVAAARLKRANRNVEITLPGGKLGLEWRERDDHVLMTGTATFEYEGTFDPALFASVA